jgi:hypothetical protein
MWPRFSDETRLSKETAGKRLAALLEPRASPDDVHGYEDFFRRPWTHSQNDPPFTGWVEDDDFQLQPQRVAWYSRSYRPVVVGRIEATEHGSVIEAVVRPPMPTIVIMSVWLTVALLMVPVVLVGLVYAFASWDWKELLEGVANVSVLMAGVAFAAVSFIPEQRKTIRLLKIALSHRKKGHDTIA